MILPLVVGLALLPVQQEAETDLKKMQGKWKIVKGERFGQPWPKDDLKTLSFEVKDNNFIIHSKRPQPSIVSLDDDTKPKQFRMSIRGGRANEFLLGIYELKGDKLKICWSRPGEPRPEKFETEKEQLMFEMVRNKKPE